ncbi:MAG: prepilin-type N-terminal cleavage/methylation domain-containing protein [Candidatus Paceibacterota bacterium]
MKDFKGNLVKRNIKGFTLIELLIVVAIIGILTAVVFVSVSSSRAKGGDGAVKSNLNTIKGASEIFYANNNFSFGSALAITVPCPTYLSTSTNMFQKDKTIADAIAEAVKRGGGASVCYNSNNVWAVAVQLKTSDGATNVAGTTGLLPDSWCVDSGGVSKSYTWANGQTIADSINISFCR